MNKARWIDLGERAGWTLLQAAVGFGITEASGITAWWAVPVATALSAAKTWVTGRMKKAPVS